MRRKISRLALVGHDHRAAVTSAIEDLIKIEGKRAAVAALRAAASDLLGVLPRHTPELDLAAVTAYRHLSNIAKEIARSIE